jgi:hypothetical protein
MVNKNIDRCENVILLDQFRNQKSIPKQESSEMNGLKLLQTGYFAQNYNDLLAIITHLFEFQETTKRVVGDEIYKIIENEIEKEE